MPILIKGVRVEQLEISRTSDNDGTDGVKFEAKVSLVKDDGTVMAKQEVNGYNADIKLSMSADMTKAVRVVCDKLKKEVETIIGIAD